MALKPVRVSQLNNYIARILQTDPLLGNIAVSGEISNLKYHGSGHIYFTLKDSGAAVRCFMPAGYAEQLRYELADGSEVIASGYISLYEKGGTYSLNVKSVEMAGEGGLMAAYRALYARLEKAGYFDPAGKKEIPAFPDTVCVITSDTGAAVRDILKILRVRNPLVRVIVYPCPVQGDGAAEAVASAIRHVNGAFPEKVDVIIAGRGGGSLEDLWTFNEEKVAEAIHESRIPVISAVGHETDFTIADFAAARRAETPTAAAVMAVPDVRELQREMRFCLDTLHDRLRRMYDARKQAVERYSPENTLHMLRYAYELKRTALERMTPEALSRTLASLTERRQMAAEQSLQSLKQGTREVLERYRSEVEKSRIMLEAADPERIIQRGYAIVFDEAGHAVTDVREFRPGDPFSVRLRNGLLTGEVREVSEE